MKTPEYTEGPEAFRRFDDGVRQILTVSHEELLKREAAYQKQSLANPKRRGRRPKVKPSA